MAQRKPYKSYYDRLSTNSIPRSTKSTRRSTKQLQKHRLEEFKKSFVENHPKDNNSHIENEMKSCEVESIMNSCEVESTMNSCEFESTNLQQNTDTTVQVPEDDYNALSTDEYNPLSTETVHDRLETRRSKSTTEKYVMDSSSCKCTNINIGEVLLMCLQLFIKHSLTLDALKDIFRMINKIFNNNKLLPSTKYMLNKLMNINFESIFYHIFCSQCKKYLGKFSAFKNEIKCTCGSVFNSSKIGSFFMEIDVESQLKILFNDDSIVNSLQERFARTKKNVDGLEDIYDGRIYKQYMKDKNLLGNPWNFSYTFNTDGCKTSFHSKVTVWPIYFMIHELPDRLRKKYMLLAGLWVSKTEPEMNIFLQPLVNQSNKLSSTGFAWMHKGTLINSKLFPLGCCVDSVARCAMLNMKQFNGYSGCTYCQHPTELINGVNKYPMQEEVPSNRTDESIKRQMIEAHEKNSDIEGVWGPSALINMQHFDLVKGMILDFMHCCLLGVTQLYTNILLCNSKEKYYIGSPVNKQIIDKRLLSMKPPTCIAKNPRSINERNMWKASEWMAWLILYSLPCLKGILKNKYFNNFALFVVAMHIFLEESITPDKLEYGRILLIKFVCGFQDLYGMKYMHYNVHLLLHLSETVANWGPLWADSTFPFESQNKLILTMKKSNYRIAQQIVNRLLLQGQVSLLRNAYFISNEIKSFSDILAKNRLKNIVKIKDCTLLGVARNYSLKEEEYFCLNEVVDMSQVTECIKYSRIIYNGCRYTSCFYSKKKKNNDSIILTRDGKYGIISNICTITYSNEFEVIIFMYEIEASQQAIVSNNDLTYIHIKYCTNEVNKLSVLRPNAILRPCTIMKYNNQYYITPIVMGIMGKYLN